LIPESGWARPHLEDPRSVIEFGTNAAIDYEAFDQVGRRLPPLPDE
jgi:hypothetical protein